MPNAPLDWKDIKNSAAKFSIRFKDAKKEESYKQTFWNEFLAMFGIDAIEVGMYEQFVKKYDNHAGEIDYFWPGRLIIEHKSAGKDLDAALDQAMNYILGIEDRKVWPRYIIVSDFKRIRLIDIIEHTDVTIKLEDLSEEIERFGFVAGYKNRRIEGQHPVNIKAAEAMGNLYDLLKKSNYPEDDLDTLLIRLVFCMFAEDSDLFEKDIFSSYLSFHTGEDGSGMAGALTEIFSVLNTPLEQRQKAMSSELMNFPYVNGGLFAKVIASPLFDREMRDCLLEASRLNWKFISPAIFGSLFQGVMDPIQRRELGAHYTSEENILKVINPLFMDDLRSEYEAIKNNKPALKEFVNKLSKIKIMDPACGCGNFLIISYRELKYLEMDAYDSLYGETAVNRASRISIDSFYGIEYESFPAQIAQVAMWLMEHLMSLDRRKRFGYTDSIIPLKSSANIVCGNSLKIPWDSIVAPDELTYIVGNPPFVGSSMMTDEQKEEAVAIFGKIKLSNSIDYVGAWYHLASKYIQGTKIRCAFVSTNSICQGEQVGPLWNTMIEKYGIKIDFAYRTFKWNNEARGKAAVHCVIVGFSLSSVETKKFIVKENGEIVSAKNISPYLIDAPSVVVESRSSPLVKWAPRATKGNQPSDGKNLIFDKAVKDQIEEACPQAHSYIRPYVGSVEFINGGDRYCLWLNDSDREWTGCKAITDRVEKVKEFRIKSSAKPTRDKAQTPHLFFSITQPDTDFIVIPRVSSGDREYIPMGIMHPDVIASDGVTIVHSNDLFIFGVLTSRAHMAWVRVVGGRLKSDYRYSGSVVYNTFPWPKATEEQKADIVDKANNILEIRSHYTENLATLYGSATMPSDLAKAHKALDKAVESLYRKEPFEDEMEVISHLMTLYSEVNWRF